MTKKILFLNIIIIMATFLTGCWNAMELNTLGITLAMGLDFEDNKVLLTAEIIEPVPAKEKPSMKRGSIVTYVQGIGENIFDAFRDITLKFDRKLYIAHNKVIILGEEFARKASVTDLDLLVRDHEQRETAYLLIAKGSKAYEVMGVASGLEEIPGNYIFKLIENFKYNPKVVKVNIAEYLRHFYDMGQQPVLGIITKKEKMKINKIEKSNEGKEYELTVIGGAAFDKEKLVGFLDGSETKAFNIIMGRIKTGIITFPTPNIIDTNSSETMSVESDIKSEETPGIDMSTVDIIKMKTKKNVDIINGNIVLKMEVKLRGSLEEVTKNIDISKEDNIKKMEVTCSKEIETYIKNTVSKVQNEFESDIFGFGSAFHRKYPKEWHKVKHNWNDIFSKADFQVKVETKLIRTGLTNTPIGRIKGR
ncbi:MAG: Ger(x)C family spore germination protein [Tissierellia bacterium]|nr:Ger(x)C family spore germination protein [Tissierellia bacterium]